MRNPSAPLLAELRAEVAAKDAVIADLQSRRAASPKQPPRSEVVRANDISQLRNVVSDMELHSITVSAHSKLRYERAVTGRHMMVYVYSLFELQKPMKAREENWSRPKRSFEPCGRSQFNSSTSDAQPIVSPRFHTVGRNEWFVGAHCGCGGRCNGADAQGS